MSNIDTNIDNYTIIDLISILKQLNNNTDSNTLDLEILSKSNVESICNNLINKYTSNDNIRTFFLNVKLKLIEYIDLQSSMVTTNNTYNKTIYINTKFRKILNSSASDITFNLSETLKNVTELTLIDCSIPFTWYNIESPYNYLVIRNSSNKYIIDISNGRYNKDTLISAINNKLEETIVDISIIFNLNLITNKVEISISNNELYTIIFHDENNILDKNLGRILGFNDISLNLYSNLVANNVLNLNIHDYFFVVLDEFNNFKTNSELVTMALSENRFNINHTFLNDLSISDTTNNIPTYNTHGFGPQLTTTAENYTINELIQANSNINNENRSQITTTNDILAIIPINTNGLIFGNDYLSFDNDDSFIRSYNGKVDIQRMHIKLVDNYGNLVNLNGSNWSLTIKTTHNNI
tara:strand:+ start:3670 stop:4899 length:1230 start_codon:yes stop_codon:yes gene_type:complete